MVTNNCRYGIRTDILLCICIYSIIIGFSQIVIQSMIAAGALNGQSTALVVLGFNQPVHNYDWAVYVAMDFIIAIFITLLSVVFDICVISVHVS